MQTHNHYCKRRQVPQCPCCNIRSASCCSASMRSMPSQRDFDSTLLTLHCPLPADMDTVQKIRAASQELGQERLKANSGLGQATYNSKWDALLKQHGQAMRVSWGQQGLEGQAACLMGGNAVHLLSLPRFPSTAHSRQDFINSMSSSSSNEDQALREMQIRCTRCAAPRRLRAAKRHLACPASACLPA